MITTDIFIKFFLIYQKKQEKKMYLFLLQGEFEHFFFDGEKEKIKE